VCRVLRNKTIVFQQEVTWPWNERIEMTRAGS
jgi:hypothetical protein